jgi:hypothetical protein
LGGWLGQSHTQGVGNVKLVLNDTQKLLKWKETKKFTRGEVRDSLPNQGSSWGSLEKKIWQRFPLSLVRICKNQQAKACWKCCKTPKC